MMFFSKDKLGKITRIYVVASCKNLVSFNRIIRSSMEYIAQ